MRKKRNYKRELKPDAKFGSVKITKFTNYIMEDGKKAVAEKIMNDAMGRLQKETGQNALEVFEKALENIAPMVEVTTRRVGGANYQVPREVREDRK